MGIFSKPKVSTQSAPTTPTVEGATQEASNAADNVTAPESLITSGSPTGLARKAKTAKASLIGGA